MINFRQYYDTFYRDQTPCFTTADEMRGVIRAYKEFRLYQGLEHELPDAEREAEFAAQMNYHIGACELAELCGDTERTIKHREAFLDVWKSWFQEISGATQAAAPPRFEPEHTSFWHRLMQNLKKWSGARK